MKLIIKKKCLGSENGISVKQFEPAADPVEVADALAQVFIKEGLAVEYTPETVRSQDTKKKETEKQKEPEKNKQQAPPDNKMVYPGNTK